MSLYDRKNNFNIFNMSLCEKSCKFIKYDPDKSRVECECSIKSKLNFWDNDTDFNDLLTKIEAKKSKSNLDVAKCNVLSSIENIISNPGFYTFIIIFIVFFIIFIIFCVKGYNLLKNKIDEIIYNKFEKEKKISKSNNKINNVDKIIKIPDASKSKDKKNKRHSKADKNKRKSNKRNTYVFKSSNSKQILENRKKSIKINDQLSNPVVAEPKFIPNDKQVKKDFSSYKPETDYELNWLKYEEAINYDKRESCDYYFSLIKSKQLFAFTFCSFNDYNSGIIKKFIFFLSFALHYTVNALFFTDSVMHKIYEDEGEFNFTYQLPKILYSAIISIMALRLILQTLVLTDKDVLEVKLQPTKALAFDMKQKKLKRIIIKFTVFFILTFILLGLFWYYLTCFNAIYINTQIYLIENTMISFAFSLFYPFIINFLPMFLRNYALKSVKKNQEYIYKLSQFIQLI